MEIVFLGTGSAWGVPEHSCDCKICQRMTELGEERTRTSLFIRGSESILVDCGPDFRLQMRRNTLEKPDAVLITHEHGDHYLGLDDLLAYRRSMPVAEWVPIPVYATEPAWETMEVRFGYLLGTLLEKRIAVSGKPLEGLQTRVVPFKTFHGPFARGSVGYLIESESSNGPVRVVYTSDFMNLPDEPEFLMEPDYLIMQVHWLNEPKDNVPHHMSLQCALEYIRKWNPRRETFLVHMSESDHVPGDPCNNYMKKREPLSPLCSPQTQTPYPVPLCSNDWQELAARVRDDFEIPCPIIVPNDGFTKKF